MFFCDSLHDRMNNIITFVSVAPTVVECDLDISSVDSINEAEMVRLSLILLCVIPRQPTQLKFTGGNRV